jgi:HSP20 family protein
MATNALVKAGRPAQEARPQPTRTAATYTPPCDVYETQDELLLFADLPGVKPEDVDVRFEKGELVIEGRCGARQEGADYRLREYGVGNFSRAFIISEAIDASKLSAELKGGVLTVHLPKTERVKPRRVAVKGE